MNCEIFAVFPKDAVLAIKVVLKDGVLSLRFQNDGKGMIIVFRIGSDFHFISRSKVIETFNLYDGVSVALPFAVEVNDLILTDEYANVIV